MVMPFDPKVTCDQECIITTFQDVYFVSESFEEAKVKMRSVAVLLSGTLTTRILPFKLETC